MNDNEFLCKYRVPPTKLDKISSILAQDQVFDHPKKEFPQRAVKHQFMIWLCFVADEDQTISTQSDTFSLKRNKWISLYLVMWKSRKKDDIHWPNAEEMKAIARRIKEKRHISNCAVMEDSTLLHLGIEQECDVAADYHGIKLNYSITVSIIYDVERFGLTRKITQ